VTDHRIGLTIYKLDRIVDGDLDDLIGQLGNHRQAELLFAGGLAEAPKGASAEAEP
jgi:peptide chain release factor 1